MNKENISASANTFYYLLREIWTSVWLKTKEWRKYSKKKATCVSSLTNRAPALKTYTLVNIPDNNSEILGVNDSFTTIE